MLIDRKMFYQISNQAITWQQLNSLKHVKIVNMTS